MQFHLDTFLTHASEQFHLARTTITSSNDLQVHDHDYAEIFWIKEGCGLHLINGESSELSKGSLSIIRPEDKHTFILSKPSDHLIITNLAFSNHHLNQFKQRYPSDCEFLFPPLEKAPFSTELEAPILSELSALTDKMMGEPRDILHLDYFMLTIFHNLRKHTSTNNCIPHWLNQAIEQYNSPHYFSQGIPGFVALCNKTTDHVNRVLKKLLNQSLTDTVNKAKLRYASRQLTLTVSPIKKITSECGYETVSYFHKIFKKHYGITPSEYRNRNVKII